MLTISWQHVAISFMSCLNSLCRPICFCIPICTLRYLLQLVIAYKINKFEKRGDHTWEFTVMPFPTSGSGVLLRKVVISGPVLSLLLLVAPQVLWWYCTEKSQADVTQIEVKRVISLCSVSTKNLTMAIPCLWSVPEKPCWVWSWMVVLCECSCSVLYSISWFVLSWPCHTFSLYQMHYTGFDPGWQCSARTSIA